MRRWLRLPCGLLLLSACTPSQLPLPPAPEPKTLADLEAWRSPPALEPLAAVHVDWAVQSFAISNGIRVHVVERPRDTVTAIRSWVPSLRDRGAGPVVGMTESLRAGTRVTPDSTLLNPKLAEMAIGVTTGDSGTAFWWDVLPRGTPRAIELLAAFMLRPVFEEREVQVQLQRQLALIQAFSVSLAHASFQARAALPGLGARGVLADADSLINLRAEDMHSLHSCSMQPKDAELIVVGPVVASEVVAWAQAAFGDWKQVDLRETANCKRWQVALAPQRLDERLLEKPSVQLIRSGDDPHIVFVVPGPLASSEDYAAFLALSHVMEQRQLRRGRELLHMGASARIKAEANTVPYRVLLEFAGAVEPGAAYAELRELLAGVRRLAATLTESEVAIAKRWAIGQDARNASHSPGLANSMIWALAHQRRPEEATRWPNAALDLTLEGCRKVADRWFTHAQPSIVLSGTGDELGKGEKLGFDADIRERYLVQSSL
jgi:predicted Zn-dependent peptidase